MTPMPGDSRPRIIDSTLREGVQAPGVRFGVAESAEIAAALAALGIDAIECGHPSAGPDEARRVRAVVAAAGAVPVLAHARARTDDIDAVIATDAKWVGIFLRVNDPAFRDSAHEMIEQSVTYAKDRGLGVRFTVEDGGRTEWVHLVRAYERALAAGADRVCFADTVGLLLPWEIEDVVARLAEALPGSTLEVHLHDDRGLADANALCAVRAGAAWVSSTVNGIGERCGVTDTVTLLANLAATGLREPVDGPALQYASRLVQAHGRAPVSAWHPVVGRHAFTHTARLHRRAVLADERTYSWTDPAGLGRGTEVDAPTLPADPADLVTVPEVISATELPYHRAGPGDRYVMIDDRFVPAARQYCIVRHIPELDAYPPHVDQHRHTVDSLFLFLGSDEGLTGLRVEVTLGERSYDVVSPASVLVPAGVLHSYRVVSGTGLFVNHVPSGDYRAGLLDEDACGAAMRFVTGFVVDRIGDVPRASAPLSETFDSLLLLDFFVNLESIVGDAITLDDVATCKTFGDLVALLVEKWPR